MKKLLAGFLCLTLVVCLAACGGADVPPGAGAESSTASDSGTTADGGASSAAGTQEKTDGVVIALMMKSLASEWNQNIEASLIELGKQEGFSVLTFDCNGDSATMLDQMNDAVNQGVDAFFMHIAEEGIAEAAVQIADDAGIPIIGESLPLKDGAGNYLAPCVVLNAAGCGEVDVQWIYDNWKSTGVDLSDPASVGAVFVTNSLTENAVLRHEGAMKKMKELFPDIPESNYFIADISASSSDYTEGGYTETGAVLAGHPELKAWIVIGVQDDYALGACRAIEEAGAADRTILMSMGGEQAIPEWKAGTKAPWYGCCYYTAMDFARPVAEGLMSVVRGECGLKDVFSDSIAEGQTYGVQTVSGRAITFEDYQQYVG